MSEKSQFGSGPFVPMNTTCTAAKAAVAAKFSTLFVEVMTVSASENVAVNAAMIPSRFGMLSTRYSTTMDSTGSIEERNVAHIMAGICRWESL